jgi:serine/threonine-protein kinase
MALSAGSRLGPYEILALLGAGGMGEVYRARDTTLNRDVAIKVLLPSVANDPDRLARFRREAQVLASLNHPNIAHIHGVQESDSTRALVMELVEGPTLEDRIAEGPIPLDEALPIARQIAEALEAAHDQGIIHRDLKPANIKVRDDETVKVLDFGLAKALAPEPGSAAAGELSQSPTITSPAMMTGLSMILGTAAYMAPEQAKGRPVDKRSDIWAFGCVLYEMLTGTRAFGGDDVSDTLANVLKSEPDWSALPPATPGAARTLLRRCLTKDRKRRLDSAAGARLEIDDALMLPTPEAGLVSSGVPSVAWWRVAVVTLAAVVVGGAAAGTAVWLATRPSAVRVTRFALAPTGAAALFMDTVSRDLTITPDGTRIVYKGTGTKSRQLLVRTLDQLEPTPLASGALGGPFSSPDGQWIGFVDIGSGPELKKVAVTGGPTLFLCRLDGQSRGATWGDDGSIIFATSATSTGLQRVSSTGGEPTVLTKPNRERGEDDHLWPQFLPGGQAVLFTITAATGGLDASQVAVLDLRTGTQKILVRGGSQAQYLPSGHLVYAAAGALRAVAFDLARLEAIGTPTPVLPQIVTLRTGTAEFDVARNGTLVYLTGSAAEPVRTLVWVDRHGHEEAIAAAPARAYITPRLSPDGKRLALAILDQDNDIWLWDFARQTLTRVTSDPGLDGAPVWMPDGHRMVFTSAAGGAVASLFWQAADGTGAAERLTQSSRTQMASAVSPDGTRVVFTEGLGDVMMLTLEKDRRVQPLVQTPAAERNAEISPDGRWLAYESNDSGQFQIFVRPFPNVITGLWPVSTGGGTQPLWARNGQELFYLAPNGALMSVHVAPGATWTASTPTKLMDAPYYHGGNGLFGQGLFRTYDVSLDDTRFLMIKEGGGPNQSTAAPPSIVVVQNWFEELKGLVPTK